MAIAFGVSWGAQVGPFPTSVFMVLDRYSRRSSSYRKIPQNQIFLGGEDAASYVANFTAALREKDYLVLRVNAHEAKENRENRENPAARTLVAPVRLAVERRVRLTVRCRSRLVTRRTTHLRRARLRLRRASSWRRWFSSIPILGDPQQRKFFLRFSHLFSTSYPLIFCRVV